MDLSSMKSLLVILIQCFSVLLANRVYELGENFEEVREQTRGDWFVKFYAPWCGHCKNLEPVWNQVAQSLYGNDIHIGRVDCTQFPKLAAKYEVKGYPTIMFFKGGNSYTYRGERNRESLVEFAKRLSVPAIQIIEDSSHLRDVLDTNQLIFFYVGSQRESLWEAYNTTAHEFQAKVYFYECSPSIARSKFGYSSNAPAVYVYKDRTIYSYNYARSLEVVSGAGVEKSQLSEDVHNLRRWVNHERFPMVMKITEGNFHEVMQTEKFLVLAVLEETLAGSLPRSMIEYKQMYEKFVQDHRQRYHEHFLFGWTGSPGLANSFAMTTLPVPSLVVINATSLHHHFPEKQFQVLTYDHLSEFLDKILANELPAYGGTGHVAKTYRLYYDTTTTLKNMWHGNPVLTAVLFGLPLGFLSLICYSIWCADILDATDDDADDDLHEKKD